MWRWFFVLVGVFSLSSLLAPDECPRGAAFVGSDTCKKCHFKQHRSWSKTKMATAFDLLKPGEAKEAKKKYKLDPDKDYTRDATCLPCHTTGYGKEGGYPEVGTWSKAQEKLAAERQGVGCEDCHGAGGKYNEYKKENKEYKWAEIERRGAILPDGKSCVVCHNKKSPTYREFKYEDKAFKDNHDVFKLKYDHDCPHKHKE